MNRRWKYCLCAALLLALLCAALPAAAATSWDGVAAPTRVPGQIVWPDNNLPINDNQTYEHTHTWGEWIVTVPATCTTQGTRIRYCSGCRETQTQAIPKTEHRYGKWKTVTEPTCTKEGKQQHQCVDCGYRETRKLKKTEHTPGEWTVTKEPTCKKSGSRQAKCQVCGKTIKETLKKVGHRYAEWEIIKEPTDHSKGRRKSSCVFCGKSKTEDFYPDGTLAPDLDNSDSAVRGLQTALRDIGLYGRKISGKYDQSTSNAVRKFQKRMKLKQDGIGWPQTLRLLGLYGGFGEPVTGDVSEYKLQLTVELVSDPQEAYGLGDELTFRWTLKNASKKSRAVSLTASLFKGLKDDSRTDIKIGSSDPVDPGQTSSGEYTYTVSKEDVLTGRFTLGFIVRGKLTGGTSAMNGVLRAAGTTESNPVWFFFSADAGSGGDGGWTPPSDFVLNVTKSVAKGPKNSLFFQKDEKIHFVITVQNPSSKSVKDVIVTDKMYPSLKGNVGTLGAGKSKTFEFDYKVSAADLSAPFIVNEVIVTYTGADGKMKSAKASVSAPVGRGDKELWISKTVKNKPANKLFFVPGEEVEFEITVSNPMSKKVTGISLYESLYSGKKIWQTIASLGSGKSVTFTYKTKTTWIQANQKKVPNSVKAVYKNPLTGKKNAVSAVCGAPADFADADGVIVAKTVISSPSNGAWYQEGEEVRYLIEVTNNTVKDIISLDVRDCLAELDSNGLRTVAAGETLKAGGTYSVPFSYTVTAKDVENTRLVNIADAVWSVKAGEELITYSEEVEVPTAGIPRVRKPDPVALDGGACESRLTGFGDGAARHDLTACGEHEETAARSAALVMDGDAEEAAGLWDTEISALYDEWISKADSEGARSAENEEAAFSRQLSALEASMSLVCGEDEAARIAVEERMTHCMNLCYELHAAPETRPDSLSAAYTDLPEAGESPECERSVTYDGDGGARTADDQCSAHSLTTQVTRQLLDGAVDMDERAAAWLRSQENWILELDTMYDIWYLSADEDERPVIAEDRMAFDDLIRARRETLADLYPDDPAAAAEVLSNLIMTRTETVCRVLHEAGILTDDE